MPVNRVTKEWPQTRLSHCVILAKAFTTQPDVILKLLVPWDLFLQCRVSAHVMTKPTVHT